MKQTSYLWFSSLLFFTGLLAPRHLLAQSPKTLPIGQLIPKIVCKKDSKYSYCLYLPKGYNADKKWPIIYAFDPSGIALRPVKLLKKAADTYGYILVGCHNYVNGPADFKIIGKVSQDLTPQVSLHPQRMYTTGFSGGSRYAFTLSQLAPNIKGVISVGAGYLPGTPPRPDRKVDWVGIVGYLDYNWQEMNKLQKYLSKLNYPSTLLRYKGVHQWPPDSVMTLAVECLNLKAMKRKEIPSNPAMITKVYQHFLKNAQNFEEQKAFYYAYQTYQEIKQNLEGLTDLTEANQRQKKLEAQASFQKMIRKIQQMQAEEKLMGDTYIRELRVSLYPRQPKAKSLGWWQAFYDRLLKRYKNTNDLQEKYFIRRMFAFAFSGAIERAWLLQRKTLKADGDHTLERLLRIAHIFWKKNWNISIQLAQFYARKNRAYNMYNFLKKAIKDGFKNKKTLENKVFDKWRQKKKFQKIIAKISGA